MTKQELIAWQESLRSGYYGRLEELGMIYANDNNTIEIGDIVSDDIGSIRVEEVSYVNLRTNPSCVYSGTELKKDFNEKKYRKTRTIYQTDLIKP